MGDSSKQVSFIQQTPKINLIEAANISSGLTSGHRMCRGCGAGVVARQATIAGKLGDRPVVVVNATGCLEVASTIYPFNSWTVPWLHNAFENAAATASGAEAAFRVLQRKGLLEKVPDIIVIGGDGGTFDIGLQSLSGAIERGHDFLYICYNNGGYMNTGIQRSSATPFGATTTTSPGGEAVPGKPQFEKDLIQIMWAHDIPIFTASPAWPKDFMSKVRQGLDFKGPAFLLADAACPRGWRTADGSMIALARLAVETCVFPLYKAYKDEWILSQPSLRIAKNPSLKKPVEELLKAEGRFKHLFKPEYRKEVIEQYQEHVDEKWERLLARCVNI